ncbi:short-chain dehydrogenase [Ureibacillus terrenus]|uniref:Short-chain dehydrogenase n=2 Tax=Caryophanaceae TaxID=186818 RepID=A0A540UZ20_9BACL|nr:short-chain dehydrogenase [Ureibacillus terrenus]MED3765066.1 short-chain dehydrogenase [Ureibacillus terrenus]TQE89717.1 short-chain dehydrogenase [Ureibacillus terrenus]
MNNVWTVLTTIVCIIIVAVSYFMTVSVMKKTEERSSVTETDVPISKIIRDHPILMNPIIIMYIIFTLFLGIMIFFLWAKYGY